MLWRYPSLRAPLTLLMLLIDAFSLLAIMAIVADALCAITVHASRLMFTPSATAVLLARIPAMFRHVIYAIRYAASGLKRYKEIQRRFYAMLSRQRLLYTSHHRRSARHRQRRHHRYVVTMPSLLLLILPPLFLPRVYCRLTSVVCYMVAYRAALCCARYALLRSMRVIDAYYGGSAALPGVDECVIVSRVMRVVMICYVDAAFA